MANPERMPRRTLRLLRLVERIAWEPCDDEPTALRREAELLRQLKPKFNRAGVWPGPKRFLTWRSQLEGLELAVVESVEAGWRAAGPYGAGAIHLHRALVRLLWCRFHPEAGLAGMPVGWFQGRHGLRVLIGVGDAALVEEACGQLSEFAGGAGQSFQVWVSAVPPLFAPALRNEDLELVTSYVAGRGIASMAD